MNDIKDSAIKDGKTIRMIKDKMSEIGEGVHPRIVYDRETDILILITDNETIAEW